VYTITQIAAVEVYMDVELPFWALLSVVAIAGVMWEARAR